jgi:hypothetical protein
MIGLASNAFLILVCRLSLAGLTPLYVHCFGLGDWSEHPVCRYSITGWSIGVMRTTAVVGQGTLSGGVVGLCYGIMITRGSIPHSGTSSTARPEVVVATLTSHTTTAIPTMWLDFFSFYLVVNYLT